MSSFSDSHSVARYAEHAVRQVPGLHALHQMTSLLLAEVVPDGGHVLVLGAGGGLELKVFAQTHSRWHFLGVDPSAQMLTQAVATLGPLASRVKLLEGYIDDAPATLFDGATCLLTLHFLSAEQRLHTLGELRRRLKPGAPLVLAHHSFAQTTVEKSRWLARYAAFSISSGIPEESRKAMGAIGTRLPVMSPEQDVDLIREAGFDTIELFYAGFTFRGWVAYAPS